jgi:hypothetical protein
MVVGDRVEIVKIPDHLPLDEVQELELCIGRVFPIKEIDEWGLVTLEIGEVTGQQAHQSVISIKPEFLEPVV